MSFMQCFPVKLATVVYNITGFSDFIGITFTIISGFEKVVRNLAEHAAKVNAKNNNEETALHKAAHNGK